MIIGWITHSGLVFGVDAQRKGVEQHSMNKATKYQERTLGRMKTKTQNGDYLLNYNIQQNIRVRLDKKIHSILTQLSRLNEYLDQMKSS